MPLAMFLLSCIEGRPGIIWGSISSFRGSVGLDGMGWMVIIGQLINGILRAPLVLLKRGGTCLTNFQRGGTCLTN